MNTSTLLRVMGRSRKSSGRWLLVAAIIAMVSLQVVAVDHWHGTDDIQHCEVCLHALDASIPSALGSVALLGHQQTLTLRSIPAYSAGPKQGTGNRDPPIDS